MVIATMTNKKPKGWIFNVLFDCCNDFVMIYHCYYYYCYSSH